LIPLKDASKRSTHESPDWRPDRAGQGPDGDDAVPVQDRRAAARARLRHRIDLHGVAEPSLARNLIYEFLDPAGVSVNGTNIDLDQSKTSVEFGGGVNLVTGGQAVLYTLYLDGDYRLPVDSDGATILHGIAGFRTDW
jgi:outer membrane autotransporter protein